MSELARGNGDGEMMGIGIRHQRIERAFASKVRECAFGHERAIALAHRRMGAKKCGQCDVGRSVQALHTQDRRGEPGHLVRANRHSRGGSSTRIASSSASTVPRAVCDTRIFTIT